jgi:hypothetical protein
MNGAMNKNSNTGSGLSEPGAVGARCPVACVNGLGSTV